jgi:hypothetical protein
VQFILYTGENDFLHKANGHSSIHQRCYFRPLPDRPYRPASLFFPSSFANKRHEVAAAQVLYYVSPPLLLGDFAEFLLVARPNWDYQTPADG